MSDANFGNALSRLGASAYRLYRSTHTIVGFAASLVGLASVCIWAYKLFTGNAAEWILAAFVSLVGLCSLALAVYMQFRYYEERQGSGRGKALQQAMPDFEAHLKHLRNALVASDDPQHNLTVSAHGTHAMQSLAAVFSALTGSACNVTVKQWYLHDGRPAVRDLFRSAPASASGRATAVDLVSENTDFEEVVRRGGHPWLTDNIVEERGYTNSHITREQLAADDVPYRSVLVTAIAAPAAGGEIDLLGFLCVDSATPGIFRRSPDVSAAQSSAHALYSILRWFRSRDQAPQEAGS